MECFVEKNETRQIFRQNFIHATERKIYLELKRVEFYEVAKKTAASQ